MPEEHLWRVKRELWSHGSPVQGLHQEPEVASWLNILHGLPQPCWIWI
jgi:hypothetical protein